MLALVLYISLGPRAALAESMVEFVIGAAILGGGGGKRLTALPRTAASAPRLRALIER